MESATHWLPVAPRPPCGAPLRCSTALFEHLRFHTLPLNEESVALEALSENRQVRVRSVERRYLRGDYRARTGHLLIANQVLFQR